MPRAKRKTAQTEEFRLNPAWIKAGIWVLIGGLLILALFYFEQENRYEQADRRFSDHPHIGPWYQSIKGKVDIPEGEERVEGEPVALWFGKVKECPNPDSGNPRMRHVVLTDARLMAGTKGKRDTRKNEVRIENVFVLPQVGEEWLFSVTRDEKGYNRTESARPYRTTGS